MYNEDCYAQQNTHLSQYMLGDRTRIHEQLQNEI